MADREVHRARRARPEAGADAPGTALWLLARGLWPVAISPPGDTRWPNPGKSPIGKGWGRERPSAPALRRLFGRHPGAGVGVLLGPAGGLVDLEIDEPEAAARELGRIFPAGVPETMGWRSARGEHRLFAWDDRLAGSVRAAVASLADGALELRLGAHDKQVASVCPPSVTSEGVPRVWNGCWKIVPFPAELLGALREDRSRSPEAARLVAPRPRRRSHRATKRRGRYGAAALARESELVRAAQPGGRNRRLNRAAFCLGQLVADGAIDRRTVETALLGAALDCGLGPREAEATIRSGIEAGLEHPRVVRWRLSRGFTGPRDHGGRRPGHAVKCPSLPSEIGRATLPRTHSNSSPYLDRRISCRADR
jgi:hypothetical protein